MSTDSQSPVTLAAMERARRITRVEPGWSLTRMSPRSLLAVGALTMALLTAWAYVTRI